MQEFLKGYWKLVKHPISLGLLTIVVLGTFWINSQAAGSSGKKVDLLGQWEQTNRLDNGLIFEASVQANSIQVNVHTREDEHHIYWMGTFNPYNVSSDNSDVTSIADPDAQAKSIFGSLDSKKTFTYNNGDLSFQFEMMGTVSTIHLSK
jgi:hypothetical protein